ncbi:MAG: sigma-70 family RNA polymerase sigma factor [Planctomycetes bacterium]|nr:sigma-70 family RNA polymerase sigma factor [Planctomycetota bacterium]
MDISNNTYAAACAGSKDAYASIVNKYKSLICAITYNTTGNIELSEEIAQEVFLTAWQHLSELRSPSKLRSWLCGIARNIARDKNRISRQKKPEAPTKDIVARSHADSDPVELAITKENQEIIWESVSGIPEIYREVLILFYREQQSIKEVAELLDLSQDTVKQRLHRSRQMLKGRITSLVEETLRSSRPGKAFTCAVLASLIPTKQALAGGGNVRRLHRRHHHSSEDTLDIHGQHCNWHNCVSYFYGLLDAHVLHCFFCPSNLQKDSIHKKHPH